MSSLHNSDLLMPLLRAVFIILLLPDGVLAQGLGETRFANSGAREAQEDFLRGLLLLHSFEYVDAREAFAAAREADPAFGMAYWGEAMTYNQPIWHSQQTEKGRAVLELLAPTLKERMGKAPTAREKDYLRAVDKLYYGAEEKEDRDRSYLAATAELRNSYPNDLDAAAFHALAILGSSHGGREFSKYMRAAAVVEDVFARNPRHPGAAHYLIHSYDDPIHAPLGLRAARVYAEIAPAAAHALHMPSHIFTAMGMWDRVVSSNIASAAAAEARRDRKGLGVEDRAYHALWWKMYGYLQQGDSEAALETVRGIWADMEMAGGDRGVRRHLVVTRAAYIVETLDCDGEAATMVIDVDGLGVETRATDAFVRGYIAYHQQEEEGARERLAELLELSETHADKPVITIMRDELKALLLLEEGRQKDAIVMLRGATEMESAMPFDFGPPSPVKPSFELLGEVQLEAGQPEEALMAFERALERAPGRARSLKGLAEAAVRIGDVAKAERAEWELERIAAAAKGM